MRSCSQMGCWAGTCGRLRPRFRQWFEKVAAGHTRAAAQVYDAIPHPPYYNGAGAALGGSAGESRPGREGETWNLIRP